jgi:hypothetical protein
MILPQPFSVELCTWEQQQQILTDIRVSVFVDEQKVPAEVILDGADPTAVHVVARDAGGAVIGSGRMVLQQPRPRIGRMAVLRAWRRAGVGAAMLGALCDEAKRLGYEEVMLHAQTHASPFYFKHGFLSHGAEFAEAGIPHQEMHKRLV